MAESRNQYENAIGIENLRKLLFSLIIINMQITGYPVSSNKCIFIMQWAKKYFYLYVKNSAYKGCNVMRQWFVLMVDNNNSLHGTPNNW